MNFTFTVEELASIRTLFGVKVLEVRTAHPWFTQIGWHGSRRCDLITENGAIGLRASLVEFPQERAVGELTQLSVIGNADTVPWPLADHKGYERRSHRSVVLNQEIVGARVIQETVWLKDNDKELLRFKRDLGFFLITRGANQLSALDTDDEWTEIDGEDPTANLYFGATAHQTHVEVDVRLLGATESRFGIHCFPGNGIVDVRLGETLHHRLSSVEV